MSDLRSAAETIVRYEREGRMQDCNGAIEDLEAALGAAPEPPRANPAEPGLLRWARWIEQQTRRTDWACRECVDADVRGQDSLVIEGFVCVWHEARAALSGKGETE